MMEAQDMPTTAGSQQVTSASSHWPILAACALLLASLLLFWPGIAEYDSIVQYRQVLSQSYDDWHPPIMARLWAVLSFARPSTAPMFIIQMAGYWIGIGLLGRALGQRKTVVLLALGATPLLLGWLAIVVKDSQLVGALTLAIGLIATFRLRERPIPPFAFVIVVLCLIYATLVRANGAFSTVPLAFLLVARPRNEFFRLAAMIATIPVVLLLSQPINHSLLGARDSGVRSSQPIYDLAAIAVRTGDPATGVSTQAIRTLAAHHCVKPLFWDPLGENAFCASAIRPWDKMPLGQLYGQFAKAVIAHPYAYIAHRLGHLNSTERWLVPLHWPLAAPPARSEPNDLGFPNPSFMATRWQGVAGLLTETPVAWPIFWVVAASWGLWNCWCRPEGAQRELATALFVSTLFQEASFILLSISSDLRYHLWAMLATALGWIILWRYDEAVRGKRWAALVIALVILSGTVARSTLPTPPARYASLMN